MLTLIVLILGLGIAARVVRIDQPVRYDESYTYWNFAAQPLGEIVSDYHVPNNHIFHSLCVHFTTLVLGDSPLVIRLPACVAGVLLIPLTILAGTLLYDRRVGLLAGALVAVCPLLVNYSVNARGYMLVTDFFIAGSIAAVLMLRSSNRWPWVVFVMLMALGAWTMPTMLYGFVALVLWLVGSYCLGDVAESAKRGFLVRVAIACAATGLIVVGLYLPVILEHGIRAIAANRWTKPISYSEFFVGLAPHFQDTELFLHGGMPLLLRLILAILLLATIIGSQSYGRHKLFLLGPTLAACLGLMTLQSVLPFARVWTFLAPLELILVAAGIGILTNQAKSVWGRSLPLAVVALVFIALTIRSEGRDGERAAARDAVAMAARLRDEVKPGDMIVTAWCFEMLLIENFQRGGGPLQQLAIAAHHPLHPREVPGRVFVVVDHDSGHSIGDSFFLVFGDRDLMESLQESAQSKLLARYETSSLWEITLPKGEPTASPPS
ncbi:MAG TPA: glycosyltransferase family 39 protein [Pirellulaceae bacterium]|nr:glycosyltransferase family 39 protein [Pirellulaceae bacterium]